jgi:ribose transport system ATP-binding protein
VDVGSKVEIYRIINGLAEQGFAIVLISSEMEEIIGMCDRAIVMSNGAVVAALERHELTEERMIGHIMGVSAS